MIQIERIPNPTIDVIGPDGFIYKDLNDLCLLKLLIEIAKNRLSGFWFYDDGGEKQFISDLGEMVWPEKFGQDSDLIYELQCIQLKAKIGESKV